MKVPTPRQLPSGAWFIQLRLGGESVPITKPTREGCVKTAQLIKAEYQAGRRQIVSGEQTVGDLVDAYIKKYTPVLSPATIRGYDTIRRNRFADTMKKRPAAIHDWQAVINAELRECSEKTVMNGWGLVSAALKDAGQPVPTVKLAPVPENELSYLEPEEIPLFVAAVRDDPCEVEMLLELHGLRASEAQQVVHKRLIDTAREQITVRGAIVRGKDGFVQKATNKSRAGTRTVPVMIPRLVELAKEIESRGEEIPTHSASMVLKHVHRACEAAGVTDVTNHGLRRSMATLAYSEGISEHVLMGWCGWHDFGTMHRIYIKCAQRDKDRAERDLKAFFHEPDRAERLTAALAELEMLRGKYGDLQELEEIFREAERIKNANEKC